MKRCASALALGLTPFFVWSYLLLFPACDFLNSSNSYRGDEVDTSQPIDGSQNFQAASAIIRAKCLGCHAEYNLDSEQKFIDDGHVVKGDVDNSDLFLSLKGNGLNSGRRDMPQGGTLSPQEIATIRTWIESIQ